MSKSKYVELFVDGGTKILNQHGKEVSIDTAKKLWAEGRVANFNLSLQRLATRANWDFAELARQYREMEAARHPNNERHIIASADGT